MNERVTFNIINSVDPEPYTAELNTIGMIRAVKNFCEDYSLRAQIQFGAPYIVITVDGYHFGIAKINKDSTFVLYYEKIRFYCTDVNMAITIMYSIIFDNINKNKP